MYICNKLYYKVYIIRYYFVSISNFIIVEILFLGFIFLNNFNSDIF